MSRNAGNLSRKQVDALNALMTGKSVPEAATIVGLNEKTLRRWLQTPVFAGAYRASRRQAFQAAIVSVQRLATTAVQVLAEIAEDSNGEASRRGASSRVTAAKTIIEVATHTVEAEDLESRIRALETAHEDVGRKELFKILDQPDVAVLLTEIAALARNEPGKPVM
jgi:predicted ArsR family transcriptional regulator